MTTPERLRRRQRRESLFIGILALGLFAGFIYFRGQDMSQERCISAFISADSETSTVRSGLVEDESTATRRVIRRALAAESVDDLRNARRKYREALKTIDDAREENPVRAFPDGVCD